MEAWEAIFRNLYTGFLLRDFAGKIVPGIFLLFSISCIFVTPRQLLSRLMQDVPVFVIVFAAGLAWTVTLGTQSLAEGLGIWRYFPVESATGTPAHVPFWRNLLIGGDETGFEKDTLIVDEFQMSASEDEKQQYERFVVIKEACGNLFVAAILSIPAWLFVFLARNQVMPKKSRGWDAAKWKPKLGHAVAVIYFVLVTIGLHRMHSQHVYRQLSFASHLVEKHRPNPVERPPGATTHENAAK
jgi:hypothetical protein